MAKFSKQHYKAIATELRKELNYWRSDKNPDEAPYRINEVEVISGRLALLFADDSDRFDSEHFLAVVRGERSAEPFSPWIRFSKRNSPR